MLGCHSGRHGQNIGTCALKLGDEVLVKARANTTITDLLEQLDKACKGGRIQDVEGFDVTAHYSQDLPEGEYAVLKPIAGGPMLLQSSQRYPCSFSTKYSE